MPIISFIITYHNEPLTLLTECLRSVLTTQRLMLERGLLRDGVQIVVVDDGSRVSAQPFVQRLDARVRYIRQECAGLSAARNRGLDCAQGEYVQFVDADDALLPQAYCRMLRDMSSEADAILFRFTTSQDEHREPTYSRPHGCDIGGGACEASHPVEPRRAALSSGVDYLLHNNLRASACCYLMRRTLAAQVRFAEGLLHEDELFTPLLLLRARWVQDTCLTAYYYRQRSSTITHSHEACHHDRRLTDTHEVLLRLLSVLRALPRTQQRALGRRVEQLTADYIYNVWRLEPRRKARAQRVRLLHEEHLLPLPLRPYTLRHWLFALATRLPFALLDALLRVVT